MKLNDSSICHPICLCVGTGCSMVKQYLNRHTYTVALIHRYKPEIPEPAPSLSWHGVQIGGSSCFLLVILISAFRQVRMSLHVKRCMAREDCGSIGFAFVFCVCGRQNPKTPTLSPIADDEITQGSIEVWDLWCIFVPQSEAVQQFCRSQ